MKTYVKPKTYGRMGNFLFQAATSLAYAWKHGLGHTLPNMTLNARHNPIYLQHLVRPMSALPNITIKEQMFCYHEIPFCEDWRGTHNIILDGYWQSEKYFKDWRKEILETFAYLWSLKKGMVSVHVRRTDYLKLAHKHPYVGKEWIVRAMATFNSSFRFQFFSDDIAWCKEQFNDRDDCCFSACSTATDDLVAMSQCEHHICSASTFSWWGAWLNQNDDKRIIIPKQWFMPGHGGLDTKDIVPPSWRRI